MADAALDIVAMGDAIVDVIASCDDAFLTTHNLPKGSMQLLSPAEADELYAAMGMAQEMSGGSAANSMAGVAAMGGNVAFVGQIADDQLGLIFEHDMHALGVGFDTPALAGGPPTGRCLILVTPDGQRFSGTLELYLPGETLAGTVRELNDGWFRLLTWRDGIGNTGVWAWLATYDGNESPVREFKDRSLEALERLFAGK